jgi:hypothetical protein
MVTITRCWDNHPSLSRLMPPFDGRHRMFDDAAANLAINMHIHDLVRPYGKEPLPVYRHYYKYEQKVWRSTGLPLRRTQVSPHLVSEGVSLNIL